MNRKGPTMSTTAPDPTEIYERAEQEGRRRLQMSMLEMVATAFIAGVTIVFGIIALGVVVSHLEAELGRGVATVVGAASFSIGVVFLVIGRSELFSENFFDPIAAAVAASGGRVWGRIGRLWIVTLVLNLVGGAVIVALMTVHGALPSGAGDVLVRMAEEIVHKSAMATFARAVLAGALLTLLSYMLRAASGATARILLSLLVGFFLALGPFDHVVVSALHLLFGIWLSHAVTYADLATNAALSTLGNVVGGLLLITFTHTAQVQGD